MTTFNETWLKRIRNLAGFLGMILPWLCLLGYYMVYKFGTVELIDNFPESMSITYYVSPILSMILTTASIVLMCYNGYDWRDNLITTISGVFGLLIVLFPCSDSNGVYEAMNIKDKVGYFQISSTISPYIHNISACIFFILLAINSFFLFTLNDGNPTNKKKIRNIVYKTCAIGMALAMLLMVLPITFDNKTWWVEMIALSFFGISWLTKGGIFKFLNDDVIVI